MKRPTTATRARLIRHGRRMLRTAGCCGGMTHLIPRMPIDDVEELELYRALERRRVFAQSCRCPCGAEIDMGDPDDPTAVPTVSHAANCPASDDRLRSLLRRHRPAA